MSTHVLDLLNQMHNFGNTTAQIFRLKSPKMINDLYEIQTYLQTS